MAISSNGVAGLRTGVCTSSTRPSGPYEGQMIYETDTDMVAVWNGSAWRYIAATTPTNGTVLQVVQGTLSTQIGGAGASYSDTGLAATITPKSTSSKVLVTISFAWYHTNGKGDVNIVRGSTQIAETNPVGVDANNPSGFCSMTYLDSPSTTSATTYKVQYRTSAGGFYFAHASRTNTIVLQEIAG